MSIKLKYNLLTLSLLGLSTSLQADQKTDDNNDVIITVTSTREDTPLSEVPASVGVIDKNNIQETKPAHPSEITNQIPGVHINVTGGEGHMTAIRQPTTTQALYLYLEDGIPTRSTGFFNHNALYEVNVPQSDSIEIIKGPGTSLYGSDAIGGVINVITAAPPLEKETNLNAEIGDYGWMRLLADTGNSSDDGGYRASLNLTHTDGWREATDYDRVSANLRFDNFLDDGSSFKTIFSATNVDQQTAGTSRLLLDDYLNDPELNYTPISYRKVQAVRLSTAYENEQKDSLLSITPYFRNNSMELLPNWSLSYDPIVYETSNDSLGVLIKHRQNFKEGKAKLITGVDIDYSPGAYKENAITPTKVGSIYTDYTLDALQYDFDATFQSVSPYIHYERSLSDSVRFSTGARYDMMQFDYDNKLSELTTGTHRRPGDTKVDYEHFSPKLGLTFGINQNMNGFVNYRHAFRAPSSNQLFRQGQAINTVNLDPVKVDSVEFGMRGQSGNKKTSYSASIYSMTKKDDILSFRNPDNTRETLNAGETSHKGIELGLKTKLATSYSLNIAASYAVHTYEDWKPNTTTDYSGNEMESAPRTMINTTLNYQPVSNPRLKFAAEWVRLGSYWMDQANTEKYDGHDLINLRAHYEINKKSTTYVRIMNLTDETYATAATYKPAGFGPEKFEYAPGMPLTLYLGYSQKF